MSLRIKKEEEEDEDYTHSKILNVIIGLLRIVEHGYIISSPVNPES